MPWITIGPRDEYKMFVDGADVAFVTEYKWYLAQSRTTARVVTTIGQIALTHLLLSPPPNMVVDHIDGNPLNNSRANLRVCTRGNNSKNRRGAANVRQTPSGRWQARVTDNYTEIHLGMFDTREEAEQAVIQKKREIYGEYSPC